MHKFATFPHMMSFIYFFCFALGEGQRKVAGEMNKKFGTCKKEREEKNVMIMEMIKAVAL